jgi:hypothetical protein
MTFLNKLSSARRRWACDGLHFIVRPQSDACGACKTISNHGNPITIPRPAHPVAINCHPERTGSPTTGLRRWGVEAACPIHRSCIAMSGKPQSPPVVALAFLSVIPSGNLLSSLPKLHCRKTSQDRRSTSSQPGATPQESKSQSTQGPKVRAILRQIRHRLT